MVGCGVSVFRCCMSSALGHQQHGLSQSLARNRESRVWGYHSGAPSSWCYKTERLSCPRGAGAVLSTGTAAKSGWLGDWGASARTVVPQTHGLHVGPAQQRYGEYFTKVLRWSDTPGAAAQQAVVLSQIVFSGFELLNLSAVIPVGDQWLEDDRPFLVVFQCGKRVWAGFPETLVRGALTPPGKASCCVW